MLCIYSRPDLGAIYFLKEFLFLIADLNQSHGIIETFYSFNTFCVHDFAGLIKLPRIVRNTIFRAEQIFSLIVRIF